MGKIGEGQCSPQYHLKVTDRLYLPNCLISCKGEGLLTWVTILHACGSTAYCQYLLYVLLHKVKRCVRSDVGSFLTDECFLLQIQMPPLLQLYLVSGRWLCCHHHCHHHHTTIIVIIVIIVIVTIITTPPPSPSPSPSSFQGLREFN